MGVRIQAGVDVIDSIDFETSREASMRYRWKIGAVLAFAFTTWIACCWAETHVSLQRGEVVLRIDFVGKESRSILEHTGVRKYPKIVRSTTGAGQVMDVGTQGRVKQDVSVVWLTDGVSILVSGPTDEWKKYSDDDWKDIRNALLGLASEAGGK